MQLIWPQPRALGTHGLLQLRIFLSQPRMLLPHLWISPQWNRMSHDRIWIYFFCFWYILCSVYVVSFSFMFEFIYLVNLKACWTVCSLIDYAVVWFDLKILCLLNDLNWSIAWIEWIVMRRSLALNKYVVIRRKRTWIRGMNENASWFDR